MHILGLNTEIIAFETTFVFLFIFPLHQADIQNLKDAVGSAVDVMQAMASSICSLSLKVMFSVTLV